MLDFLFRARFLPSFLLVALATSCTDEAPAPNEPVDHLALGNPSGAVADIRQPTNYLLTKPQYALSYHRDRGIPNWVSWHLASSWLGTASRQDDFRADNTLPAGWYRVTAASYTGSGFDRGHHCPSADRTATEADNSATFLMTNMLPQAPENNQQTWVGLEEYCRLLAGQGNELYIIMGQYGSGGTGANGVSTTLDNGRVTVPRRIWKVVLVLPEGRQDVSRVSRNSRLIAIDTPNSNTVAADWGRYRTSVDAIEAAAGLDLLSAVDFELQTTLEAQVDTGPTQ